MSDTLMITGLNSRTQIEVRHNKAAPLHLGIYLLSLAALVPSILSFWMQGGWLLWLLVTIIPQALLWYVVRRQNVGYAAMHTAVMVFSGILICLASEAHEVWSAVIMYATALAIPFYGARASVRDMYLMRLRRRKRDA